MPDFAGAGNINGAGAGEVHWYHAWSQFIYVLRWNGNAEVNGNWIAPAWNLTNGIDPGCGFEGIHYSNGEYSWQSTRRDAGTNRVGDHGTGRPPASRPR
ncbi:hypothetical protein ACPPVO_41370 [Dactylosporangium sp. McL0621]|uniref:hypothetical protein n=1 Tax=Dactylosporangium sp. McL0621 TaxID=3415678 RepID=UPI003CFA8488